MKNFLIVGGSSGIGFALCKMLLDEGHQVYCTYLTKIPEINHQHLISFQLDVRASDQNLELLPDQLDGIVYCPGAINLKPFNRLKPEEFAQDYDLQVIGAVRLIQHNLDRLKQSGLSSVVLFSSVAASLGFNFHSVVSASKAAVEGLARSLAAELAPTIRVNVIAPSITNTPLASKYLNTEEKIQNNENRHPMKRIGQAEDLANTAKFLLSKESSWMTGQVLSVDGGISSIVN
ncbi:MAG: SDR family oxidoreductase [Reichenbachiella sp.]|uniref:SDR family NAD(P)-dependent oxidoreductase n=1 Tax=Reichenbachiella sp. TaxID=2184521 RepID=UPI003267647F